MLLRARIVLPISGPPISDGAVLISKNRVAALGRWSDLSRAAAEPVTDLGQVILLPGLVNAHCHLDYTEMAGQPAPKQFPDWIKGLLARKAAASYADYAQAWLRGAAMLLRTGVTTVGDIEAVPELLPDVWSSTPMRVASFLEMTGVQSRRDPGSILQEAAAKIAALRPERGFVGLSPHALYSTTPALLRAAAQLAAAQNWRVTMHVAESIDEFEMCAHSRGPLFDWLKGQRDMSDCGHGTPVQQVARCGLLSERFLAIHANYLDPADIAALAQSGSSVVHCPRSHAYFKHRQFPYKELAAARVNICLGTDSLASVAPARPPGPELNLFTEMQTFASLHPEVTPSDILRLATCNGARALGLQGCVGEIAPNSFADLITLPYAGKIEEAESAVVHYRGDVTGSMIDGRWAATSPKMPKTMV
jgi:cytosine/adenosine deaminase-related metal-dependent hydrolase